MIQGSARLFFVVAIVCAVSAVALFTIGTMKPAMGVLRFAALADAAAAVLCGFLGFRRLGC